MAPVDPKALKGGVADVCMIFEGSYPYARGGVSIWADSLIRSLPDLTFHLWCLSARQEDCVDMYPLPPNVVGRTDVVLFEGMEEGSRKPSEEFWRIVRKLHDCRGNLEERSRVLWQELFPAAALDRGPLDIRELLLSAPAFKLLVERYQQRGQSLSFIDYFYTCLFTHLPLLKLLNAPIPQARLFHAISTGYAGFLGCKAKWLAQAPLLLTEHGIYTNERQVEISLADWIYSRRERKIQIGPGAVSLKKVWIEMFDLLGRLTYDASDRITTLFGGNRDMEIRLGADPRRLEIIPNGVDLPRFGNIQRRTDPERPLVGLVGRVVPIKDIRTFIKACRVVADRVPKARFMVIGPTDQTPAYYEKCLDYRRLLGLDDRLEFTGNAKVEDHYGKLDVVALTSVSEALPLTVLEAMAVGVPLVCTRVGACEELLEGRDEEDQAMGPSGIVCTVGEHQQVGDAISRLLEEPALARKMGDVGQKRVRKYYDLITIERRYGELYRKWLKSRAGAAA